MHWRGFAALNTQQRTARYPIVFVLSSAIRAGSVALTLLLSAPSAVAAHAYAQFGDIKYQPNFSHFEWANPQAPKGGELSLVAPTRVTQFDKYNPFTLKGTAPPGIGALLFDTLLTGTMDEPTTAYGLLAEDIQVSADKLSVVFRLNPKARFHNGKPVLAADVKHSFDTLVGKGAHPGYRIMFGDVSNAVVLDERTVRFNFKRSSAELPLMVGGLPVFSRDWGAGKPFDQVITEKPIGSGPYRIGRENFGRDITYDRDANYWARDLNVRRGVFNFDRITYKIYKDNTAQLEAFKAGEFDYMQSFRAREWAREYHGRRFSSGELTRTELKFRNALDYQGFFINTRRAKFADPRVREAIGLALDFEWMNRQLFFNAYTRVRSYFGGGDFEATGLPGPDELAVLEPLRKKLPAKIFTEPAPLPPTTAPPASLRGNLRRARALLADAGWTYRDGALRNAKGEAFTIEFLEDDGSGARIVTPYAQALAKLGIQASYRQVDFALMQKRMDTFDFDMTTMRILGQEAPGASLPDRFTSAAAKTEGSSNFAGVSDPAVDAIVSMAAAANTRPELVARLKALDRVLRHGYYTVPHWYAPTYRVAYNARKFGMPSTMPLYYQAEDWVVMTWWSLR